MGGFGSSFGNNNNTAFGSNNTFGSKPFGQNNSMFGNNNNNQTSFGFGSNNSMYICNKMKLNFKL